MNASITLKQCLHLHSSSQMQHQVQVEAQCEQSCIKIPLGNSSKITIRYKITILFYLKATNLQNINFFFLKWKASQGEKWFYYWAWKLVKQVLSDIFRKLYLKEEKKSDFTFEKTLKFSSWDRILTSEKLHFEQ